MDAHPTRCRNQPRHQTIVQRACLAFFAGLARHGLPLLIPRCLHLGDVALTPTEMVYLREHKKVTLCVDPDWVPYEQIDASGKHVGIAADLLAAGLRTEQALSLSWCAPPTGMKAWLFPKAGSARC